jgi:hypothetical protein
MEQHNNKTEHDFRDKLSQREIMPSAQAWDRLDAMLTVAEEKKSTRGYGWLYIAAAILGFLLIGTVFFSQTEEVIDKGRNEVVFEGQPEKPATNLQHENVATVSDSNTIASTEKPTKIKTDKNNNHHPSAGELAQQSESSDHNQSTPIITRALANWRSNQKSINPVEAVNQVPDTQKLAASTNPIITRAKGEQAGGNQKTDRPASVKVDELLAAAQSTNPNPKTSVKVNAKNLLSEVDKDVNLTFREKMLRRASEVASTVANRNNE